jgi:hypothetical protein
MSDPNYQYTLAIKPGRLAQQRQDFLSGSGNRIK